MFTCHRLSPANKLDCPHLGTNAFSPQRAESFRHFLLLPSPSVACHGRKWDPDRSHDSASEIVLQKKSVRLRLPENPTLSQKADSLRLRSGQALVAALLGMTSI